MRSSAPGSTFIPSFLHIFSRSHRISASLILSRSKRITRDNIVSGTLLISVVARRNITCDGGSSSVLRRALKAHFESICTSSIM